MVEALFEVPTSSGNETQRAIASDLDDNQEETETPKPNKYQRNEDIAQADSFTGDVSEPEQQFKSPHTLLHASQSRRRTTTKTYAQAVYEGSGSEDEAEVKMQKKAVEQKERKGVVKKAAPTVRSYMTQMTFVLIVSALGNFRL